MRVCARNNSAFAAFTLLEVLVVIGILVLLASLTIPAIGGMQSSYQLSQAAALVQDRLLLARQLAITRNEPIVVHFCKVEDELGERYLNALALVRFDRDGNPHLIERPVSLPSGFSMAEDTDWSSISDPTNTGAVTLPAAGAVDTYFFRFMPSGGTSLPPTGSWFLTIYGHRRSEEPGDNFVTIALDPVTGRVFTYQP